MAIVRVRSSDGSNSDDGSTWALAKLDMHTATTGALAAAGAGGTVYVSQAHAGSYSVRPVYSGGTLASPIRIICADDSATDPSAVATTATETTSANGFDFLAFTGYVYGISFISTYNITSTVVFSSYTFTHSQEFENCVFNIGTGSAGSLSFGHTSLSTAARAFEVTFKNCDVKLPSAKLATMYLRQSFFTWNGGSVLTNTNLPTYLFTVENAIHGRALVSGVDLSVLSGKTLVSAGAESNVQITFVNCKLPASVTLCTTPGHPQTRISMYGCDSSDSGAPHRFQISTYAGSIYSETSIVATSGASDGTTPLSWKMVATANAEYPSLPLISDPIYVWNSTTGSSKTLTVEFLSDDGTTLYNDDVWMDVEFLGTSGQSISSFDSDSKKATILTARTECTTGAGVGAWSNETTGAKSYKLVSTFMPQEIGYFKVTVHLAKASATIYVDPKVTVA